MANIKQRLAKFGRRALLTGGFFTATLIGNPVMGQNNRSNDSINTEYTQYTDSLYQLLQDRYAKINPETAKKLAKKSTDAYLRLLNEGNVAAADSFMVKLHENFEAKEVAAARKKAYTVRASDSEKLKVLKKNTGALYKRYLEAQKKFLILDAQLVERRKTDEEAFKKTVAARDSALRAEGKDPKTVTPLKFEPSRERLELELRHANNMDDMVNNLVELSKNDMILYEMQLKEDKKMTEADIKLYETYQKRVDLIKEQLKKLQLENYKPDSLLGKSDHDRDIADNSQYVARTNLAKKEKKDKLEAIKKGLEAKQKAILAKHELKTKQQLDKKLVDIKADLKEIKKNKEVEIKAFKIDAYKGSDQQKYADGVKSDLGLTGNKNKKSKAPAKRTTPTKGGTPARSSTHTPTRISTSTQNVATLDEAPIIRDIAAKVAEKKDEFAASSIGDPKVVVYDNNVVETSYNTVDAESSMILEYPSGKAAIIEGDTTTVYNINGHVSQYIKNNEGFVETLDGQVVENSTVTDSVQVLRILNATGKMR